MKYNTPADLSQYAIVADNQKTEELKKEKEASLTDLYEKARYSKEECSKEEAQSVRIC